MKDDNLEYRNFISTLKDTSNGSKESKYKQAYEEYEKHCKIVTDDDEEEEDEEDYNEKYLPETDPTNFPEDLLGFAFWFAFISILFDIAMGVILAV